MKLTKSVSDGLQPRPRSSEKDSSGVTAVALLRLRAAKRRRGERGVALLLVLGTLAILTVMLTEFQDSTSAELGSSVAARDQVKAEYAARSAVNLTRLLIAAEPTIRGPLSLLTQGAQIPVWEYTDVILGAFNDVEGGAAFEGISGMNLAEGRNLGMADAGFELVVIDEDSKINLNLAARADAFSQKRLAEQLLGLIGGVQYNEFFEETQDEKGNPLDRATVCSAIIDWVDPDTDLNGCDPTDTTAGSSAPEDSYYQLLKRPYQRKNAAFDSLEELRLVKGVSDDFWRRFIAPDPDDPRSRIITIWGGGKVNVNSGNPVVLLATVCHVAEDDTPLCVDPLLQQKYLMAFQMMGGALQGVPVFGKPEQFVAAVQGKGNSMIGSLLESLEIPPVKLKSESLLTQAITTESSVFSIYATGYVKAGKRQTRSKVHAVVDMRGAPPPGTAKQFVAFQQLTAAQGSAAAGAGSGSGSSGPQLPAQFQAGGLARALVPRPGGSVIYYRVD